MRRALSSCRSFVFVLALVLSAVLIGPSDVTAAPWPAGAGSSVPISGAESDLSGATWNPESQALWVVRQNRRVWEFTYDSGSQAFELAQSPTLPSEIGSDIEIE